MKLNVLGIGFALLAASAASAPARAAGLQVVYYDISGRTAKDLFDQMQTRAPEDRFGQRFPAYTEWRVTWNFRYESTPESCRLTELNASVEAKMTLPRWVDAGSAPASLLEEWQHYVGALRIHENGHYAHGVEAAREVQALEGSIPPAGDCAALTRQVTERAQAIMEKFRALDAQYDRDTNHGQKQGAVLVIEN
jgi:predicted secreted Zn-dependent protease